MGMLIGPVERTKKIVYSVEGKYQFTLEPDGRVLLENSYTSRDRTAMQRLYDAIAQYLEDTQYSAECQPLAHNKG